MTPLGRGRGRSSYPAPLRRPGQMTTPPDYILSMNALVPDIVQPDLVDVVMKQVAATCSSPAATRDVVDTIYSFSIKNRNFAKVAGEIMARIISLEGCKKTVLDKLEKGFDERDTLFADGGAELTNFVCLLGFFYNKAVLKTGVPLRVVAEPLAICLSMVVNRNTPRIEIFAEQLVINGERLQQHAPSCLEKLMIQARELLVLSEPPLDKGGIMYLLLCFEMHGNKFQQLTESAAEFYLKRLSPRQVPAVISALKAGAK